MSFLARFRILTKILAIVMLMAVVAAVISALGISALSSLNAGADNMNAPSKRALIAARANQNVIALNRSEFRIALDPRPENREQVRKDVDEQTKEFQERIDELGKTRDEQARAMMPAVKEAWSAYQ
jgi:methyl-accepting chemotaxis protein